MIPQALGAQESVPYIYPQPTYLEAPLNPAFTERIASEAQKPPVFNPKHYLLGLSAEYGFNYPLAQKIIDCESQWEPHVCNHKFGCTAGQGLFQLIPSTVKDCEQRLGRELDPFNPKDNIDCGVHLLVRDGTGHWGTADTDWGSYQCWGGS